MTLLTEMVHEAEQTATRLIENAMIGIAAHNYTTPKITASTTYIDSSLSEVTLASTAG